MEHLLTTKRLDSFSAHRAEEAQHLVREVWAKAQNGKVVNLREVLGGFSMNNVTRMLLGKQYFGRGISGESEAKEFMNITHELFRLLGVIYLGDYLPFWRWVDPYGCEEKMREVEKKVDEFHSKIIEEHRIERGRRKVNGEEEDGNMDFVDVLLSLPGEDGKEHMDDKEIKALIQVISLQIQPICCFLSFNFELCSGVISDFSKCLFWYLNLSSSTLTMFILVIEL